MWFSFRVRRTSPRIGRASPSATPFAGPGFALPPALLLLVLLVGCGEGALDSDVASDEARFVVEDDRGLEVRLQEPAGRVVSIIPSMTEMVMTLGAGDALVARTRYDRDPSLAHLPSLGGTVRPNLEAITDLRPDLVIAWSDEDHSPLSRRLRAMGIPVYHASVQRIDDIRSHALRLGRLLDRDDAAAHFLETLEARLAALREDPHPGTPPSVLYIVWHDPPQTAGPGTFLDEIIEVAGGSNIFRDARSSWPQISMEEILRRNPDVVVTATRHDGEVDQGRWLRAPGWQELPAVRSGQTLAVNADLFNRPGPGVAKAAEILHAFLREVAGMSTTHAGGHAEDRSAAGTFH